MTRSAQAIQPPSLFTELASIVQQLQQRKLLQGLVTAAILLVAVTPFDAGAQPRAKVHRIGYIQTATPDEQEPLSKAFEEGLRELGYVEGRDIVIERRFAWGKQERLPDLAADLVRLNVDVIVTGANPVIAAVKRATTTIPVVMTTSRDPVGSGFIASLARPGGNISVERSHAGSPKQETRVAEGSGAEGFAHRLALESVASGR